ncbi:hypothetical protein C8R45DRAFT_1221151 [Mycena sanguinolenta]|nr:hypothetical protein C8R45DRAFT_1221151 [Mycena sanguinolenta]
MHKTIALEEPLVEGDGYEWERKRCWQRRAVTVDAEDANVDEDMLQHVDRPENPPWYKRSPRRGPETPRARIRAAKCDCEDGVRAAVAMVAEVLHSERTSSVWEGEGGRQAAFFDLEHERTRDASPLPVRAKHQRKADMKKRRGIVPPCRRMTMAPDVSPLILLLPPISSALPISSILHPSSPSACLLRPALPSPLVRLVHLSHPDTVVGSLVSRRLGVRAEDGGQHVVSWGHKEQGLRVLLPVLEVHTPRRSRSWDAGSLELDAPLKD